MPQNGYDGPLTLAAGANRVVTIAQAAGYTGPFAFACPTIRNKSGASIYCARRSDVDASNGREIPDQESYTWPPMTGNKKHDFNKMYIYSLAGGSIDVDFE